MFSCFWTECDRWHLTSSLLPSSIILETEIGQHKVTDARSHNLNTKAWFQRLLPLPLVTEVAPVPLRLLHGEASTLNEALCYRTGLVDQAQTPRRHRPALDGVRCKKGRCYRAQEARGVRVGHPARFHGNCHQLQELVGLRIPGEGKALKSSFSP